MNPHYPLVAQRAGHRCEYCRAPEAIFNFPFEVEHILPPSQQGTDDDSSLRLFLFQGRHGGLQYGHTFVPSGSFSIMPRAGLIKPTHKAVQLYYHTLQGFDHLHVTHEGALRSAFQTMLADTARTHNWTLVPELATKAGGKRVVPDGTMRDPNSLPRGYWEAKDTGDDLDTEITRKSKLGYPLTNTIFEDTREAVLFQNKSVIMRVQLTDRKKLADLLNQFYAYTEPDIENFEHAVDEFKERVPELAHGLADKIKAAHKDNKKFHEAFDAFFALCQTNLNPNISRRTEKGVESVFRSHG